MTAVVTGADGFAGRWLCRHLLADGVSVTGWVRRPPDDPVAGVKYRIQDIRDGAGVARAMGEESPEYVFHLAAMTHVASCEENAQVAVDTNVTGAVNVFSSMPAEARGVFASTCHVYGRPSVTPTSESHPLNAHGVYAQSKVAAELAILRLNRHVVIARAFHHTGPEQSRQYVLADWAGQIRDGVSTIRVGNLDVERDFCDVRDIVAGYVALVRQGEANEPYNLCSGVAHPLAYLLSCMTEGRGVNVEVDAERLRAGDVSRICGDPRRASRLGWRAERSVEETLRSLATTG